MRAYVEVNPDDRRDISARAWSFDLAHWGISASAGTPSAALELLQRSTAAPDLELGELIEGRALAFSRDLEPATPGERAATLTILERARARTLELVAAATDDQLTRPAEWAPHIDARGFDSARFLVLSYVDAESREYPAALGLPGRPEEESLLDELEASHEHAMRMVAALPEVLITATAEGDEWTAVKVLRLLAWRERAHAELLEQLLTQ